MYGLAVDMLERPVPHDASDGAWRDLLRAPKNPTVGCAGTVGFADADSEEVPGEVVGTAAVDPGSTTDCEAACTGVEVLAMVSFFLRPAPGRVPPQLHFLAGSVDMFGGWEGTFGVIDGQPTAPGFDVMLLTQIRTFPVTVRPKSQFGHGSPRACYMGHN